jgi:hypothetical protein
MFRVTKIPKKESIIEILIMYLMRMYVLANNKELLIRKN